MIEGLVMTTFPGGSRASYSVCLAGLLVVLAFPVFWVPVPVSSGSADSVLPPVLKSEVLGFPFLVGEGDSEAGVLEGGVEVTPVREHHLWLVSLVCEDSGRRGFSPGGDSLPPSSWRAARASISGNHLGHACEADITGVKDSRVTAS